MSHGFEALSRLRSVSQRLATHALLPSQPACAALQLIDSGRPGALPDLFDLEALRGRLKQACSQGRTKEIIRADLRRAPYVFWNGNEPAARFPGLIEVFFETAFVRQAWLLEAIEAWLRDFAPEEPGFARAGEAMEALIARSEHPRVQFWAKAQREFAFLTPSLGPKRVGDALLYRPSGLEKTLSDIGMDDPLRAQGLFFRHATSAMVDALPTALQKPIANTAWERATAVLETYQESGNHPGRVTRRRVLRFPDMAAKLARACLAPWLSGTAAASAPKEAIQDFLVVHLEDPRLPPEPLVWREAGEDARRLMRSWLAAETLEVFLKMIGRAGGDRQWRYREAFWRACLKKCPNPEVWIVLGTQLAGEAGLSRELKGTFGRMQQTHQAALLMRLNNVLFSEKSNIGALRAWDPEGKVCPPLYRTGLYTAESLQAPSLEFPPHPIYGGSPTGDRGLWHQNPERGLWQGRAAALLRQKTGILLTPADYMPK